MDNIYDDGGYPDGLMPQDNNTQADVDDIEEVVVESPFKDDVTHGYKLNKEPAGDKTVYNNTIHELIDILQHGLIIANGTRDSLDVALLNKANTTPQLLTESEQIKVPLILQIQQHMTDSVLTDKLIANKAWRNALTHDGSDRVGCKTAALNATNVNGSSSIESLLALTRKQSGAGSPARQYLPSTKIWVTIAASDRKMLNNMFTLIAADKRQLGMHTAGFSLTAMSAYRIKYLVDHVLSNIRTSSLNDVDPLNLGGVIKTSDIWPLINGQLKANHPYGYRTAQPCMVDPDSCSYVAEGKIDFEKIERWVEMTNEEFDWMKAYRTPKGRFSYAELKAKWPDDEPVFTEIFSVEESVELPISIGVVDPTIDEYLDAAARWIAPLETMADEVLSRPTGKARQQYLHNATRLSAMRTVAAFISVIRYGDADEEDMEPIVVNDPIKVDLLLDELSNNQDILTKAIDAVAETRSKNIRFIAGVPVVPCPSCHRVPVDAKLVHPQYIPFRLDDVFGFACQRTLEMNGVESVTSLKTHSE